MKYKIILSLLVILLAGVVITPHQAVASINGRFQSTNTHFNDEPAPEHDTPPVPEQWRLV